MNTFRDIIDLWPSCQALADDLGLRGSLSGLRVRKWRSRDSIPANHWLALCKRAKAKGFDGVTLDRLAEIAATRAMNEATNDAA